MGLFSISLSRQRQRQQLAELSYTRNVDCSSGGGQDGEGPIGTQGAPLAPCCTQQVLSAQRSNPCARSYRGGSRLLLMFHAPLGNYATARARPVLRCSGVRLLRARDWDVDMRWRCVIYGPGLFVTVAPGGRCFCRALDCCAFWIAISGEPADVVLLVRAVEQIVMCSTNEKMCVS